MTTQSAHSLSSLIAYFETCNRAEGKSPHTVRHYTEHLSIFQRYMRSRRLPEALETIDAKLVRDYLLHLMGARKRQYSSSLDPEPLSKSTIHGYFRALRAFANWLVREDLLTKSFMGNVKAPRVDKKVITILSEDEIVSILRSFSLSEPHRLAKPDDVHAHD